MSKDTEEYIELLVLRDYIAKCPKEEQEKIHAIADTIRGIVLANPVMGVVAVALLGAEIAAEEFPPKQAIIKDIIGDQA